MSKRIYLCDDDTHTLEIFKRFLTSLGYQVKTFNSPGALIEAVYKLPPDTCLIDSRMPALDGLNLYKCLKAIEFKGAIHVMSAHGEIVELNTSKFYIRAKPHNAEGLQKLLEMPCN